MKTFGVLLLLVASVFAADNIRLIKDEEVNQRQGRVEVMLDGKWGQVCSDGFGSEEATVVCRSVSGAGGRAVLGGEHGIGKDPIVIGGVNCVGTEESVFDCQFKRQDKCSAGTIAAVDCSPKTLRTSGSLGLEAGIIAGIIIALLAIIGIAALLITCLWRNDLCCAGQVSA